MINACVVDASVGIKLFVEEEGSEQAQELFEQLAGSAAARIYVPDLFFAECANILWKYVRRFGYPADNARQDVTDLRALPLRTVSTANLLPLALELALAFDITVYDACYAALAGQTSLPFVTADEHLAGKLKGSEVDVHILTH